MNKSISLNNFNICIVMGARYAIREKIPLFLFFVVVDMDYLLGGDLIE